MNIRVLCFSFGPEIIASSRVRVYQYIPYLKKCGISVKAINLVPSELFYCDVKLLKISVFLKIKSYLFKKFQIFRILLYAKFYDVVVVQRVLLAIWEQNLLKFINPRIIFDFDDALYVHPKLVKRFKNMLKISKHLITESIINQDYIEKFNKPSSIIISPVDIHRYSPRFQKREDCPVVIGWIGSASTIQYFAILHDILKILKSKYKEAIVIKVVGSGKLNWDDIAYEFYEWQWNTEVKELQSFDIGIMPLEDNEWCRGKGGYKLLQYMSVAVPCVGSPVGVNKEIIREGINGFLANTEQEWIERMSYLIENPELRIRMGIEGRRIVEKYYSYEQNAPKLASILRQINAQR